MKSVLLVFLLLLALAACGSPVAPDDVRGAIDFRPPPVYVAWAEELLVCAVGQATPGEPSRLVNDVRWMTAEDLGAHKDGWLTAGRYDPAGPTIYLLPDWVNVKVTVKHELTHHLLWRVMTGGDPYHRSPLWACQDR